MNKKNKRGAKPGARPGAGDQGWEFSPWAPTLAFLPYRIGTKKVEAGAGFAGGDVVAKVELGKPVPITRDDAERLYEVLLEFDGITPEIRHAILKALGLRQRVEEQNYRRGWNMALRHLVDEADARIKKNGEHPRGGRREAARAEVAAKVGMKDADTLRKRLQRLNRH